MKFANLACNDDLYIYTQFQDKIEVIYNMDSSYICLMIYYMKLNYFCE